MISTILYKTTFVLKDGYKFFLSMFVTASFAHVCVRACVHIFVHFPLCIMVLRGDLTLSGGSGQINDHIHLPLRLQVNLCRGRKKETESKSARNNTTEQWVRHGGSPPAQTNTPVHMQEVIILTRITLCPDTPYYYGYTLLAPVYSWY